MESSADAGGSATASGENPPALLISRRQDAFSAALCQRYRVVELEANYSSF
jgi:hypothetical protein